MSAFTNSADDYNFMSIVCTWS